MIGSIGGFNPSSYFEATKRQQNTASFPDPTTNDSSGQSFVSGSLGKTDVSDTTSAKNYLKDYNKKSPIERMEDAWLKEHKLSREQLKAMPPEEREKILKQMKEDIERKLKDSAQQGQNVDITA